MHSKQFGSETNKLSTFVHFDLVSLFYNDSSFHQVSYKNKKNSWN